MHFSQKFQTTPDFAAVRRFLLQQKFEQVGGERFRRSTRLRTMVAFDPSRWQVEVEVNLANKQVDMVVATDGQLVTPRERAYFATLFAELIEHVGAHTASTELMVREPRSLSRRAAEAALNENVAVTFGFFMSLPIQVGILHFVLAVPMIWAIVSGTIGSLAIAYAVIFSIKNRQPHHAPRK